MHGGRVCEHRVASLDQHSFCAKNFPSIFVRFPTTVLDTHREREDFTRFTEIFVYSFLQWRYFGETLSRNVIFDAE